MLSLLCCMMIWLYDDYNMTIWWSYMRILWGWHSARIIFSQKIYGLYGPIHHIVEMWRCHECRTTNDEQGKIVLLSLWMLEGWVSQQLSTGMWVHSDISISSNASAKYSQGSGALVLSVDDNFQHHYSLPTFFCFLSSFVFELAITKDKGKRKFVLC